MFHQRQKDNVDDVSRSRSLQASAVHFVSHSGLQQDAGEAVMRGRHINLVTAVFSWSLA